MYLPWVPHMPRVWPFVTILSVLSISPRGGWGQGLPSFTPLNPVAVSRSGVYFEPLRDPAPRRWSTSMALDYASVIEYNQFDQADYVLDSEIMRLSFAATRE